MLAGKCSETCGELRAADHAGAEAAAAAAKAAAVGFWTDIGVIAGLAGLAWTGRVGLNEDMLAPVCLAFCCAAWKDCGGY